MSKSNRKLLKQILEQSDAFEVGMLIILSTFSISAILLTILIIITAFIK